jgi:hypothetical protein
MDKEFLARVFGRANSEGSLYEGSLRDFAVDQTAGKWPNEIVLKGEVEDMRKRDDIIALATILKSALASEYEQRLSQKLDFGALLTLFAADMILCVPSASVCRARFPLLCARHTGPAGQAPAGPSARLATVAW